MSAVFIGALAFGQQGGRTPVAGPSNDAIGSVTLQIYNIKKANDTEVYVGAQWETALPLRNHLSLLHVLSRFDDDTHYITTQQAIENIVKYAKLDNAQHIVLVGHPLHLFFIRLLIMFGVWKFNGVAFDWQYNHLMKVIPYDRSKGNIQWWTRGPVRFVLYLVKALFTKKHGS